jgi:hypothetical protein
MPNLYVARKRRYIFLLLCPRSLSLGLTIWRRGALSLQARGHIMSFVFGDWWKAER